MKPDFDVKRLHSRGVLPKWHDKNLSDYDGDPNAKYVIDTYMKQLDKESKRGLGIFLFGSAGTGKSYLMNTSFIEIAKRGYSVQIISFSSLITKFTASWYSAEERTSLENKLMTVDFLGVEEIGKKYNSSELALSVFETVLIRRIGERLPTWFTSNAFFKDMGTMYGPEIQSKLSEACLPIQVMGNDKRKAILAERFEEYNLNSKGERKK